MLKRKQFNREDISAVVDEMINSPYFIHTLYESDMSLEATKKELMEFVPKIEEFVRNYVVGFKKYVQLLQFHLTNQ